MKEHLLHSKEKQNAEREDYGVKGSQRENRCGLKPKRVRLNRVPLGIGEISLEKVERQKWMVTVLGGGTGKRETGEIRSPKCQTWKGT